MTDTEKKIEALEKRLAELKKQKEVEDNQTTKKPRFVVEQTPNSVRSFVDGDYYVRDLENDCIITTSYSDDKEFLETVTKDLNSKLENKTPRELLVETIAENPLGFLSFVMNKIMED